MKKIFNDIYSFLTMDNSHEEDDEEFVYMPESDVDRFMCKAAIGAVVLLMVLGCIM